jgi:SAM-dependent methyltransferase
LGGGGVSGIERVHDGYVLGRRVSVLSRQIDRLLEHGSRVLDVGCGDGAIGAALSTQRPDLEYSGVDVLVRPHAQIPVREFDGRRLPFPDNDFDTLLAVDVLHHAAEPEQLLRELTRVARKRVVIKDHRLNGLFAGATLRFMDRVGNARHGVDMPHNYWREAQWREAFDRLGLRVDYWTRDVGLYPAPASWLFDRGLHFIAALAPPGS